MDQGPADLMPVVVGLLSLLGLSIVFRVNLLVQQIQMHTKKLLEIVSGVKNDGWNQLPSQGFVERVLDTLERNENSAYHQYFGPMRAEMNELFLQYRYQDHLLVAFRWIFGALILLTALIIMQSKAAMGWRLAVVAATGIAGVFLLFSTKHISTWKEDWFPYYDRWQKISKHLKRALPKEAKSRQTARPLANVR